VHKFRFSAARKFRFSADHTFLRLTVVLVEVSVENNLNGLTDSVCNLHCLMLGYILPCSAVNLYSAASDDQLDY